MTVIHAQLVSSFAFDTPSRTSKIVVVAHAGSGQWVSKCNFFALDLISTVVRQRTASLQQQRPELTEAIDLTGNPQHEVDRPRQPDGIAGFSKRFVHGEV